MNMDSPWWSIPKGNQLKKLQNNTDKLVNELEIALKDFENKGDAKELSSKIKNSIKNFQQELS